MPTHVALLRGINVGGHNKVPMPALRDLVGSLGHTEVASYIQSGNVVFTADGGAAGADLAAALERAVADTLGVTCGVVVLTRADLAGVIKANPYPDEADPKLLHAVFRQTELTADGRAAVTAAAERAAAGGSPDEVTVVGSTVYLHLPNGIGRSVLAELLARPATARKVGPPGTARNWATVRKLQSLLDA